MTESSGSSLSQCFLKTSLESLGFSFASGNARFHRCIHPESTSMNLNKALIGGGPTTERFLKAFDRHIEDERKLQQALQKCLGTDETLAVQPSLIRILLNVDSIQQHVVGVLLEKLVESAEEGKGVQRQILQQMRWLDNIIDGKELSEKLVEIIPVCPPPVQRDLIAAIPDIVDDRGHRNVIKSFMELMQESSELTVPILDAFSNLTLKGEIAEQVVNSVLNTLVSTRLEDLPVLIRFLLQSTPRKGLQKVVTALRMNLNFFGGARRGKSAKQDSSLILDTLKSAVRFQRAVALAFFKEIAAIEKAVEHKILDLWILLMIHSLSSHRRQVESLMKKKILAELFTLSFFKFAFQQHRSVVQDMSVSLLTIASTFLQSDSAQVRAVGGLFYTNLFSAAEGIHLRQDVVGNLITHVGSGMQGEINSALDQLQSLCERLPSLMQPMVAFVRGMLDFLEGFTKAQIRKVYQIFGRLATCKEAKSSTFASELMIVIRKQLTNPHFQDIGVVGAVALLSYVTPEGHTSSKDMLGLLDSIFRIAKSNSGLQILLADEFSLTIERQTLTPELVNNVQDKIADDFEAYFLNEDLKEEDPRGWMGISGEGSVAIGIWPTLNSAKSHIVSLPASFRLLQICEGFQHQGSRLGIDALLAAKLFLYPKDREDISNLAHEDQEKMCSSLFYAIQWTRELLNAFGDQKEEDVRTKVAQRARDILELEAKLGKLMKQMGDPAASNFIPFGITDNDFKTCTDSASISSLKTAVKLAPKSASKSASKRPKKSSKGKLDKNHVPRLRKYYRTVSLKSLQILEYPLKELCNQENFDPGSTLDASVVRYMIEEMRYLLNDTDRTSSSHSRMGRGESVSAADMLSDLLPSIPYICHHADASAEALQRGELEPEILECCNDLRAIIRGVAESLDIILRMDHLKEDPLLWKVLEQFALAGSEEEKKLIEYSEVSEDQKLHICKLLYKFLKTLHVSLPHLGDKVFVMDLMEKVVIYTESRCQESCASLSEIGHNLLVTRWSKDEKLGSGTIGRALRMYIGFADDPLDIIESLVATMTAGIPNRRGKRKNKRKSNQKKKKRKSANKENEPEDNNAEDVDCKGEGDAEEQPVRDPLHATLSTSTLPAYYSVVVDELVKSFSRPRKASDTEPTLVFLSRHARAFKCIMQLCKIYYDKTPLLTSALKSGRAFVERFVRHNFQFVQTNFSSCQKDIVDMLKAVQQGTRVMQMICTHGKRNRVSNLISIIPTSKKVLENFIYQVKKIFKGNDCLGAFWQGNLKHRGMDGKEISQPQSSDEEDEREDETDDGGTQSDEN